MTDATRTLHDERVMPWRPMAEASKDRKPILLKFVDKLEYEGRPDLARWNGLMIVGRHPGLADDGFDIGWNFAAPVGMGGFPDEWFEGWRSLAIAADPYTAEVERLTVQRDAALKALEILQDRADSLTGLLAEAAAQFHFYEQQHLAKTPPDEAKAATNREWAERLEAPARIGSGGDAT